MSSMTHMVGLGMVFLSGLVNGATVVITRPFDFEEHLARPLRDGGAPTCGPSGDVPWVDPGAKLKCDWMWASGNFISAEATRCLQHFRRHLSRLQTCL